MGTALAKREFSLINEKVLSSSATQWGHFNVTFSGRVVQPSNTELCIWGGEVIQYNYEHNKIWSQEKLTMKYWLSIIFSTIFGKLLHFIFIVSFPKENGSIISNMEYCEAYMWWGQERHCDVVGTETVIPVSSWQLQF